MGTYFPPRIERNIATVQYPEFIIKCSNPCVTLKSNGQEESFVTLAGDFIRRLRCREYGWSEFVTWFDYETITVDFYVDDNHWATAHYDGGTEMDSTHYGVPGTLMWTVERKSDGKIIVSKSLIDTIIALEDD
jgi:hypothetical protein